MIYILFILLAALSVAGVNVFAAQKGVADLGVSNIYKPCDNILPYRGKKLILITIVCFVISLAIQISLYKNTWVIIVSIVSSGDKTTISTHCSGGFEGVDINEIGFLNENYIWRVCYEKVCNCFSSWSRKKNEFEGGKTVFAY